MESTFKRPFGGTEIRMYHDEGKLYTSSHDVSVAIGIGHIQHNRIMVELAKEHNNKGFKFLKSEGVNVVSQNHIFELLLRSEAIHYRVVAFLNWFTKENMLFILKYSSQKQIESLTNDDFVKVYTTTEIAKMYGISAIELNDILHELKVQYKVNGKWVLYHQYQDLNYVVGKPVYQDGKHKGVHQYWTLKGVLFIRNILDKRKNMKMDSVQSDLFDQEENNGKFEENK